MQRDAIEHFDQGTVFDFEAFDQIEAIQFDLGSLHLRQIPSGRRRFPARSMPDIQDTTPAAQLAPGLPVEVIDESDGWAAVRCENGWECWVDADLLVPRTDSWASTHRIPPSGLAAYSSPVATEPVAELDPGLEVDVIGRVDPRAHVRFENGWSCWVDAGALDGLP